MEKENHIKGFALVIFAIFVWSGWMVVSRFALKGSLTPYDITAIRFATAGLFLLPVAFRKGLRVKNKGFLSGFILSLLIGACYTNVTIAGMQFAPVSHASTIINGTLLVMTTIIGIFLLSENVSNLKIIGVCITILGINCMIFAKNTETPNQWIGHLLFMLGGIMWASYTTLVKVWKVEALHGATIVSVFSMLMYLPLYLIFAHSNISLENWHEVLFQSLYQGVLTAIIALIAFNKGVHLLGVARSASLIPLVPVFATIMAIPILGEMPNFIEWIGVSGVSIGVFLASGAISRHNFNKLTKTVTQS